MTTPPHETADGEAATMLCQSTALSSAAQLTMALSITVHTASTAADTDTDNDVCMMAGCRSDDWPEPVGRASAQCTAADGGSLSASTDSHTHTAGR